MAEDPELACSWSWPSVETMLLTIQANKVIRIDVADNTLDLSIYLWERNWPSPHDVRPEPLVLGIDRRG